MTADQAQPEDQIVRLQREIRALAAVNRQLQMEVEGRGASALSPPGEHRADQARAGASRLGDLGPFRSAITEVRWGGTSPGELVRVVACANRHYLIEGNVARPVSSTVVLALVESALGGAVAMSADELAELVEGEPVTLSQTPTSPPFLVVSGLRIDVRGWPKVNKVPASVLDALATGPEVDAAKVITQGRSPGHNSSRSQTLGATGASERLRRLARRFLGKVRR